jgi:hypothetical protein
MTERRFGVEQLSDSDSARTATLAVHFEVHARCGIFSSSLQKLANQ